MTMRKYMRGVTLTELMIVVVIVSILAMVSYPSYREYAARAKRNEAKAALLRIAQQQERFYLNNNTYTCDMTQLGFAAAGGVITDSRAYQVDVTACTPNAFTAQGAHGRFDDRNRRAQHLTFDHRPPPGAFLPGAIKDHVQNRQACFGVDGCCNLA